MVEDSMTNAQCLAIFPAAAMGSFVDVRYGEMTMSPLGHLYHFNHRTLRTAFAATRTFAELRSLKYCKLQSEVLSFSAYVECQLQRRP